MWFLLRRRLWGGFWGSTAPGIPQFWAGKLHWKTNCEFLHCSKSNNTSNVFFPLGAMVYKL